MVDIHSAEVIIILPWEKLIVLKEVTCISICKYWGMTTEDNELVNAYIYIHNHLELLTFSECDFEQRFDENLSHKARQM